MPKFTIWVHDQFNGGTAHVSSHTAKSVAAAKKAALRETAQDWGWDSARAAAMLSVLGVAKGDIELLEWNDAE